MGERNDRGCLITTRRPGDSVEMELASGEIITLTLLKVNGAELKMAIKAPRDVLIQHKKES